MAGKEWTKEEMKQVNDFMISNALRIFLDAKETLIVPEDAVHKLSENILKNLGDFKLKFAYQFVDKMSEILLILEGFVLLTTLFNEGKEVGKEEKKGNS